MGARQLDVLWKVAVCHVRDLLEHLLLLPALPPLPSTTLSRSHSLALFLHSFLIGVELVLTATMGSFCYGEFSHPSSFFNLPIVATLAAGNIVVMTIHASGKFESKADLLKKYKSVGNNLVAECEVQIATFARDALQTEASLKLKAAYVQVRG